MLFWTFGGDLILFGEPKPDRPNLDTAPACAPSLDHLRRPGYGLTRDVVYQKRCIRPVVDESFDRKALSVITDPLIGPGQLVSLDKACEGWEEQECAPINVAVPPAYPVQDYSSLLFGVATSLDRLRESVAQFESWLANSGAQLLVVITDSADEREFGPVSEEFRSRGIALVIVKPWNSTITQNEQHFTIVRDLLQHATPETKWAAIIDDDTFFPSLYQVGQILAGHNHTAPAYLGGLSENSDAVKHHGYMAFGGAGVFLSIGLLQELDPHLEECLDMEHVPQGDGLLKSCIYNKTETQVTVIPGLHQLDFGGDMSGFYEAGRLPISLHHWKSWHHAPVDKMAKISEICGGCFLQRVVFGSDTVLSNGYSIVQYPLGTESVDLDKTEGTWDGAPGFEWSLGPMREKLARNQKKSYRLIDSERIGKSLRQIYVHQLEDDLPGPDDKKEGLGPDITNMKDEVIELWWG